MPPLKQQLTPGLVDQQWKAENPPQPSTRRSTNRRWPAGLAALALWHYHTETALGRTESPHNSHQRFAPSEPHTTVEKTLPTIHDAPPCNRHEVVAISTQMIAIVTRAGDTLQDLQTCYSFDIQRTNAENEFTTPSFPAGKIILLFK
jgi:hypothetical protein